MSALLYLHSVLVVIFFVIYLFKTFFLFVNNKLAFFDLSKKGQVFEMIIIVLILGTGVYLLYKKGWDFQIWMYLKFILVILSILIAIIGTKQVNKWLLLVALLCIFGTIKLSLYYGPPIHFYPYKDDAPVKDPNDRVIVPFL